MSKLLSDTQSIPYESSTYVYNDDNKWLFITILFWHTNGETSVTLTNTLIDLLWKRQRKVLFVARDLSINHGASC